MLCIITLHLSLIWMYPADPGVQSRVTSCRIRGGGVALEKIFLHISFLFPCKSLIHRCFPLIYHRPLRCA